MGFSVDVLQALLAFDQHITYAFYTMQFLRGIASGYVLPKKYVI